MKKKLLSVLLVLSIVLSACVFSMPALAANNFTDISSHWAKTYIEYVANTKGVMEGQNGSTTTFAPNSNLTRGEMVMILGKVCGIKESVWKENPQKFSDVPKSNKFYAYVAWASEKGITSGTSSTTFSPNNSITRQDFAVFFDRYATAFPIVLEQTIAYPSFSDQSEISAYAVSAVRRVAQAKIMTGSGGKFNPKKTITRAECAVAVYNFYIRYASKEAIPSRTVKVAVGLTNSFGKKNSSPTSAASTIFNNAKKPFLNRWNINLTPNYHNLTNLPEDKCSNWDTVCGASCGTCRNSDTTAETNHHKNWYRNFYYLKSNMSNYNSSIRIVMTAADLCSTDKTLHDKHWAGLTLDDFCLNKMRFGVTNNVRIVQHEMSHVFKCPDHGNTDGFLCIMSGGFDNNTTYDLPNLWCPSCTGKFAYDRF